MRRAVAALVCCLPILAAQRLMAQDRLPAIPPEQMSEEQRQAAQIFQETRGVPVFGPFVPLLRSPELMLAAKTMGDYLRYRNALPLAINELVILITAREWDQQVEWQIHYPAALKAGLKQSIADAVGEGRKPEGMSEAEEAAWSFSTELHRQKQVSDQTYRRAKALFGEQGVIDMAGTNGYYDFLAMVMNMARTAPDPAKKMMPELPQSRKE
jgi:4-carboxymuconolactone decarboxylase